MIGLIQKAFPGKNIIAPRMVHENLPLILEENQKANSKKFDRLSRFLKQQIRDSFYNNPKELFHERMLIFDAESILIFLATMYVES